VSGYETIGLTDQDDTTIGQKWQCCQVLQNASQRRATLVLVAATLVFGQGERAIDLGRKQRVERLGQDGALAVRFVAVDDDDRRTCAGLCHLLSEAVAEPAAADSAGRAEPK